MAFDIDAWKSKYRKMFEKLNKEQRNLEENDPKQKELNTLRELIVKINQQVNLYPKCSPDLVIDLYAKIFPSTHNIARECKKILEPLYNEMDEKVKKNAGEFYKIPLDLLSNKLQTGILDYLSGLDKASLGMTCKFFSNHSQIKETQEFLNQQYQKTKSLQIAGDNEFTLFCLNGKVFGSGKFIVMDQKQNEIPIFSFSTPTQLKLLKNIIHVDVDFHNAAFVTLDGLVYVLGQNTIGHLIGRLGLAKETSHVITPTFLDLGELNGRVKEAHLYSGGLLLITTIGIYKAAKGKKPKFLTAFDFLEKEDEIKQIIHKLGCFYILTQQGKLYCKDFSSTTGDRLNEYFSGNWGEIQGKIIEITVFNKRNLLLLSEKGEVFEVSDGDNSSYRRLIEQKQLKSLNKQSKIKIFNFKLEKENAKRIFASDECLFIVTEKSLKVYANVNVCDQLGIGSENHIYSLIPVDLESLSLTPEQIKQIWNGKNHSFLWTTDNRLFACGRNWDNELGVGWNLSDRASNWLNSTRPNLGSSFCHFTPVNLPALKNLNQAKPSSSTKASFGMWL